MYRLLWLLAAAIWVVSQSSCCAEKPQANGDWDTVGEDFLMLFLNPAIAANRQTFGPQIRLAEEAGVKKFSFYSEDYPFTEIPSPEEWKPTEELFKMFGEQFSGARLLPRIGLMNRVGEGGLSSGNGMVMKNGTNSYLSWSSPEVQKRAEIVVRNVIDHYEQSASSSSIWGYQIAAEGTGEWIPRLYREKGVDYSVSSLTVFRAWLGEKYSSDEQLRAAWGNPKITRDTAEIPIDIDHRFPIIAPPIGLTIQSFYTLPQEQDWVDYSEFISELTSRTIRRLAKAAKEASAGKKVVVFYGYIFELPGSMNGHLKAEDILRDPNIDMVAAPISYQPYSQRLSGGVGGAMSAIDSFPLHKKTWINEDDFHTHAQPDGAFVPPWYWDSKNPDFRIPKDLAETQGVLKRNLAAVAFHHGATWWMDLYGGGWYSDPGIWKIWKGELGNSLRNIRESFDGYAPTVAVIVDEKSRLYEKFMWTGRGIYSDLRNAVMGSGATVGFYYLGDYLEGKVPQTEATVFVNLWRLGDRKSLLKERIGERGGVVIWQYAPGFADDGIAGIKDLTEIAVNADTGRVGSHAADALQGVAFGGKNTIAPRIVIHDGDSTILAQYAKDGLPSASMKKSGNVTNVLIGDYGWTARFAHNLFKYLNIRLVSDSPALVYTSDNSLFVYAIEEGQIKLKAPDGTSFLNGESDQVVFLKENESLLLGLKKL